MGKAIKNSSQLNELRKDGSEYQLRIRRERLARNPEVPTANIGKIAEEDVFGWRGRRRDDFSNDCWLPWPKSRK